MKRKLKLIIGTTVLLLTFVACRSAVDRTVLREEREARRLGVTREQLHRYDEELPLLKMSLRYPPLLPAERAHKTIIKVNHRPESLSEGDLAEIYALAGRVPGLLSYEVRDVRKSIMLPECYDVWMPGTMLRVKTENQWVVYRIDGEPVP